LSALEIMTVLAGLSLFLGLAMFAYSRYQGNVHLRLCHKQQRELQGQLETIPSPELDCSIEELFAQLVKSGLLAGKLSGDRSVETVQANDPGAGPDSFRNYLLMPGTKMFGCRVHGSPYAEELF
jgi:hypothetical protein